MEGVEIEVFDGDLVLRFDRPAACLSYAPYNGGYTTTRCILNHHVVKGFSGDVGVEVRGVIERLGLPEDTVGFLTAARVEDYCVQEATSGGVRALAVCTVGLSNARGIGEGAASGGHSTINTFVVVDRALTAEGLVNALASAVEAKALAMFVFDIRSVTSGRPAVGTSTDALAVATLGLGVAERYAGTATGVGSAVGEAVFGCVGGGVVRDVGVSMARRLRERGVGFEELFEAASRGVVGRRPRGLRRLFMRELKAWLEDPNVCALLAAAMRLDDEGSHGTIPSLPREEYLEDSPRVLVDETIGEAIATYIAGTKGANNFRYYDMLKPGVVSSLPMFLDDAVCGLVGGVMSRVYERVGSR